MPDKPSTADGYHSEQVDLVRATCLYVATKLGDLMDDLVVVGGLAPSLLIDQQGLARGADLHVGTLDLDVGLSVALLDHERYRTITKRLRRAGFTQDVNADGNPTRQRWKIEGVGKVTVDFLIPPTQPDDVGGALRNIEADFAALIAPGLHLAFRDRRPVSLSGQTIMGEDAARDVWVCGPGAYVVLKALAFDSRGENKDAYDLFYVVRNFGSGLEDIAVCLRPLLEDPAGSKAIAILRRDFLDHNGLGPRRVAEFLTRGADDAIQADVVGFARQLLERCD
ncbi:hypothetical protein GF314_03815 [bacterium]|nr:hypothetical protein [bacterium]